MVMVVVVNGGPLHAVSETWSLDSSSTTQCTSIIRDPKDHINIRILQNRISGIPLILSLRTRMSDPCVHVVFWAPYSWGLWPESDDTWCLFMGSLGGAGSSTLPSVRV